MYWIARLLCQKTLHPSPVDLGLRNSRLRGVRLEGFRDPRKIVLCLQPFFGAPTLLVSRGYLANRSGTDIEQDLASLLKKTSRFRRVLSTAVLAPSWLTHLLFSSQPSPVRALLMTVALPWHRLILSIAGQRLDPEFPLPGFSAVNCGATGARV